MDSLYRSVKNALPKHHYLLYGALLKSLFNEPASSNKQFDLLLKNHQKQLTKKELKEIYNKRVNNYVNLYQYAAADNALKKEIEIMNSIKDTADFEDLINTQKIWKALKTVPPQKIYKTKTYNIPLIEDKAGLLNIKVAVNKNILNMVFDTGANFSTIQRSVAKKIGLKIIPSGFSVGTATSKKIQSDLAIAKRISINDLVIDNVVFLVVEDESLTFPETDYSINAIIGYPAIKVFEEIQIINNKTLVVPAKTTNLHYKNFAIDNLTPVVLAYHNSKKLRFHFDTGANNTDLYPLYFKENKTSIEKSYQLTTSTSGGAGGSEEYKTYELKDFDLKIGGANTRLKSVSLFIDESFDEKYLHGNLGQDFIKSFKKMVISFKNSYIMFE